MNGLLGFPDGMGGGFMGEDIPDPFIPMLLELLTVSDMLGDNEVGWCCSGGGWGRECDVFPFMCWATP